MANKKQRFSTFDTSSSENEDDEEDRVVDVGNPRSAVISSDSSEEGEEEIEEECHVKVEDCNCPICLNDFTNQRIGVPNNCNHLFCVDCILEWSKNANSCPVDRTEFTRIRVYQRNGGSFVNDIVIEGKPCEKVELLEINCELCRQGDNEDMLLLCDGCDRGYHCQCLNPPLLEVPSDEWFCDDCLESMTPSRPPRQRHARMVGRTMASERVRSQISRSRLRRARIVSNLDEQLDAIFNEIIANAESRMRILSSESQRLSRARKTTRKRRKTTKRSKSKRSKSTRRKKKRSSSRKASKKCSTSINKKESNRNPPVAMETPSGSLSLFGGADDLDEYLAADDIEERDPSYLIARKHRMLSRSAIRFNVPLPSLFAAGDVQSERNIPIPEPTPTPFLLDNILSSQEVLLAPSQNLSIKHGKLSLNKKPKPGCGGQEKKKKDVAVPNINQAASSPKAGKSGASSSNKPNNRTSRNSTDNDGASTSLSKRSHSTSNENTNSSVNGQNEDNPGNSSENFHKPDKNLNKESKKPLKNKNSSAVVKTRKILIRPVFNLPKNENNKNESNIYDPFEAMNEDLSPEKEQGLYDPFQPIVSDEEVGSPVDSGEKTPDSAENFRKFSFKSGDRHLSDTSEKNNLQDSAVGESVDLSHRDVVDLPDDSMNSPEKLKIDKSNHDNQTSPANKPAQLKKEEFDMFADEVQKPEELQEPAADVQNPEEDEDQKPPENSEEEVKETVNAASEDQVKLPDFLPTPAQEDTTVKFRRVFEKPKESSNENNEEEKDVEDAVSDDEYQPPLKPVQMKTLSKKSSSSKEGEGTGGRRRRNRSRSTDEKEEKDLRRGSGRDRRSRSRSIKRQSRGERGSRNRRRSTSRSRRVSGGRSRRRSRSRSQRKSRKSRSRSRSRHRTEKSRRRSRSRSRRRSPRRSRRKSEHSRSEDKKNGELDKTPPKEVISETKQEKNTSRKKSPSIEPVSSPSKPDNAESDGDRELFTDKKKHSKTDVSTEPEDIFPAEVHKEKDGIVEEANDTLNELNENLPGKAVKEKASKTKKSKKHKLDKERSQHEKEKVIFTSEKQNEAECVDFEKAESVKLKKTKKEKRLKKEIVEDPVSDDSRFPEKHEDLIPVRKKSRQDVQKEVAVTESKPHQSDSLLELRNTQERTSTEESNETAPVKSRKKMKKLKHEKEAKGEILEDSLFIKSPKKKKKKHKKERESDHFFENKFSDDENTANKAAIVNDNTSAQVPDKKSEKKSKKKKKQHQQSDSEFNQTLEVETPSKSSKKVKHKKHKSFDSDKHVSEKKYLSKHEKDVHSTKEKLKHFKNEHMEFDLASDELKPEISDDAYADMLLDDLTAVKEVPKPPRRSFEVDEWSKDLTLDPSDIKKHTKPNPDSEMDIDDLLEASFKKSADTVLSSSEKVKPGSVGLNESFDNKSPGRMSKSPSPYSPTQIDFESPNYSESEEKPSKLDYKETNWSPEMLPISKSPLESQPSDKDADDKQVIKIVEDPNISCIEDIFADSPKIEQAEIPKPSSPAQAETQSPIKMFSMSMGKAPAISKNTLFSDASPVRTLPLLHSDGENINQKNEVEEEIKSEMTLFDSEEKETSPFRKITPISKVKEATEIAPEELDSKNIEKSSEEKSSDKEIIENQETEVSQKPRSSRSEKKRSRHHSSSSSPTKRRSHRNQTPKKRRSRSRSRKRTRDNRRSSSRSKKSSRHKEDSSKRRKRSRTPDQKSARRRSRSPRRKRRSRTPERRWREGRRERHRSSRSPKPDSKHNPKVVDVHKDSSSGSGRLSPQPIATISSISTIGHSFNRDHHSSMNDLMPDTPFEQLQTRASSNSALIQIPTLDHANLKQVSDNTSSNITLTGSNPANSSLKEVSLSEDVEANEQSTSQLSDHKDGSTLPNTDTSESAEKSPLPPPPPPKKTDPRMESTSATAQNILTLKALTGLSTLAKEKEESVLNPTQILNIVGLNPTQQSAAKNAIMNIAELSKKLQLGQFLAGGNLENPSVSKIKNKDEDELSPLSINDVEGSAVEMYNKDKVKQLQKKKSFQEEVVEEAKNAIKPHYERREINKTQYKDIMKRAVNKICQTDRTMEVNAVKIRRLIRRYVECYQEKNEKHKEKMRSTLDKKVDKHTRSKKLVAPPMSPPSPLGSPLTGGEYEDTTGGLILKKEPRKIVTLPDLPLPPPPPPPKPRYMMK